MEFWETVISGTLAAIFGGIVLLFLRKYRSNKVANEESEGNVTIPDTDADQLNIDINHQQVAVKGCRSGNVDINGSSLSNIKIKTNE